MTFILKNKNKIKNTKFIIININLLFQKASRFND